MPPDSVSSLRRNDDQSNSGDYRDGAEDRWDGNTFALLDGCLQRPEFDGITTPRVGEPSEDQRDETGANENESKDANGSSERLSRLAALH